MIMLMIGVFAIGIVAILFFTIYGFVKVIQKQRMSGFSSVRSKYYGVDIMSESKRETLEGRREKLVKQIARLQAENPELIDNNTISRELSGALSDTNLRSIYDGYFAEAGKRSALRQVSKTVQEKRIVLDQITMLCKQLARLNRALAELSESEYEREIARVKNEIRRERLRSGQVKKEIEKEEELRSRRLDLEEARLDAEIQEERDRAEKSHIEVEAMRRGVSGAGREKGLSAAERGLQSTKDRIEMMKAKSESLDMIKRARDEDLASTTDDELKEKKRRMWNQFFMEKMEE